MKITKLALLTTSIFLLTNCGKEDAIIQELETEQKPPKTEIPEDEETEQPEEPIEPKSVTYLTYNAHPEHQTTDSDNYLIVHDQEGNLLDYRPYESGDHLVFQAMDTALINVQHLTVSQLTVYDTQYSKSHNINSYTEIETGVELFPEFTDPDAVGLDMDLKSYLQNLKERNTEARKEAGSYNLTVNNVDGVSRYLLSKPNLGTIMLDANPHQVSSLQLYGLNLEKNETYYISAEDLEDNHRYLFFEVPEQEGDIILDFNDFEDFGQTLEIDLPEHQNTFIIARGYLTGESDDKGFDMNYHMDFGESDVATIGYLDHLAFYNTYFSISLDPSYTYNYSLWADHRPESITIAEKPTLTIADSSRESFEFTASVPFLRQTSNWVFSEYDAENKYISTNWSVSSASGKKPRIGALPQEVTDLYPDFNLDKIAYKSTALITKGFEYDLEIARIFSLYPTPTSYEFEVLIVNVEN